MTIDRVAVQELAGIKSTSAVAPKYDYSVVVPCWNSENTLKELCERTRAVFGRLGKSCEIILVDDGSADRSWEVIGEIVHATPAVKGVRLSGNFGQHNALMCGFHFTEGSWVVTIDDDLQLAPEDIPKLIERAGQECDVVYGALESREQGAHRNLGSYFVLAAFRYIFKVGYRPSAFRLIRSDIVSRIRGYSTHFVFIDGLIAWVTKKVGVAAVGHHPRRVGRSGYNIFRLFELSLNLLSNFSILPLQLASLLGFAFSAFGFALAIYFFLKKLILGIPVTGYTSLVVLLLMFSGVQLITIGLIGEYLGRINLSLNRKPQFIVAEVRQHAR